jgi:hypothetical protein
MQDKIANLERQCLSVQLSLKLNYDLTPLAYEPLDSHGLLTDPFPLRVKELQPF